MKKGDVNPLNVLFGLIIGVVVLGAIFTFVYQYMGNADEQYHGLINCGEGLITNVAADGGKCFIEKSCQTTLDEDGNVITVETPTKFSWQYIGKGWGCPGDNDKEPQYCCLQIPQGENHVSYEDVVNTPGYDAAPKLCEPADPKTSTPEQIADAVACNGKEIGTEVIVYNYDLGDKVGVCQYVDPGVSKICHVVE